MSIKEIIVCANLIDGYCRVSDCTPSEAVNRTNIPGIFVGEHEYFENLCKAKDLCAMSTCSKFHRGERIIIVNGEKTISSGKK